MVARKDFNIPKHHNLEVRNLYVIKAMQSLTSRGYVRTNFSWMWYYYYLTEEGIAYLRDYLGVDPDVLPKSRQKAPVRQAPARQGGDRSRQGGDRSRPFSDDRKLGRAPGAFEPSFVRFFLFSLLFSSLFIFLYFSLFIFFLFKISHTLSILFLNNVDFTPPHPLFFF